VRRWALGRAFGQGKSGGGLVIRIVFLDADTEHWVPHVVTDAQPVSSYVLSGERKDSAYGYMASSVLRRATVEEVEAWRDQAWAGAEGEC